MLNPALTPPASRLGECLNEITSPSFFLHQVLSEATEDNLIDLGPGSPAVVSNMASAAPSSLPPNLTASGGRPSSPATLASRLAGLGMKTEQSSTVGL